jgi:hypothetical protein
MPCYNSLAADRHADEMGRLADNEIAAERWIDEMTEDFDDGYDNRFVEFEDVLDTAMSEGTIHRLIEHAWKTGEYRQLGEEIHRELNETFNQQLHASRGDIEHYLLRNPDPGASH